MKNMRYALAIVLVCFTSMIASPSHEAAPPTLACDSSAKDNTDKICYIDVNVDVMNHKAWTDDPKVTFKKPSKVMIVWRVKDTTTKYAFQADGLWLPVNADVKAFDKPCCQSADQTNCEQTAKNGQRYFIWQIKQASDAQFDYKLKLYPTDSKDLDRYPIEVQTKIKDPNKLDGDPIWVDPTIVIQG